MSPSTQTERRWTNQEKREAIRRCIRKHPEWSDRRIAEAVGVVSHPTVGAVRAELEEAGELETLSSRIGRDGVERPVGPSPGVRGERVAHDRPGTPNWHMPESETGDVQAGPAEVENFTTRADEDGVERPADRSSSEPRDTPEPTPGPEVLEEEPTAETDPVLELIRTRLEGRTAPTLQELRESASEVDPAIFSLTDQEFDARYVQPAREAVNAGG